MRIAWLSYGFIEYSIRQANALSAENDVLLVLAAEEGRDRISGVDPRVDLFQFRRPRLRQTVRQFMSIRRIIQEVNQFRPDVIHFQSAHLWFNLALPLLRHIPLVVTIHDPSHHEGDSESLKTPRWLVIFGYRRADRVIVHGRSLVDVVHNEIGIPRDRIHVVAHVAIGGSPGEPTVEEDGGSVLFFGRIWEYKGLEYLIKAEPLISRRVPGVRITIAGRGEDLCRYRPMMENPGHFVVHEGWISDERRSELFQRAAVVVLPYISASQSGVVSVAYAHGKPVVATRVGALPEYVEDRRSGLLVPPRDEKALAGAVIELLLDPQMRRAMGECGRRKLHGEWSPEVVARCTVEVYERAIRDLRSQ